MTPTKRLRIFVPGILTNDNLLPTLTTLTTDTNEEDELFRLGIRDEEGVFPRRAARAVHALERGDECTDANKNVIKNFGAFLPFGEKI